MNKLREAAQAALETLDQLQGGCTDSDDGTVEAITVWCPEIIDAIRAALAAPEAEPVDELTRTAPNTIWLCVSDEEDDRGKPYSELRSDGAEITWSTDQPVDVTVKYVRADLAHPAPARVPMTEDEMEQCWESLPGSSWTKIVRLIRAVEAFHEIKEKP